MVHRHSCDTWYHTGCTVGVKPVRVKFGNMKLVHVNMKLQKGCSVIFSSVNLFLNRQITESGLYM